MSFNIGDGVVDGRATTSEVQAGCEICTVIEVITPGENGWSDESESGYVIVDGCGDTKTRFDEDLSLFDEDAYSPGDLFKKCERCGEMKLAGGMVHSEFRTNPEWLCWDCYITAKERGELFDIL